MLASNRSFASSTAASLLPEPLLDLERPLDLDLVLDLEGDLDRLLLLPEGDLDRDLECSPEEELSSLNLDPVSSPSSILYTE